MGDDRSDIVGQQPVKAHIAKSQLGVALPELPLPIGPEGEWSVAAADPVLPRVPQDVPWPRKTAPEFRSTHTTRCAPYRPAFRQSCRWRMPIGRRAPSTTTRAVIGPALRSSI